MPYTYIAHSTVIPRLDVALTLITIIHKFI